MESEVVIYQEQIRCPWDMNSRSARKSNVGWIPSPSTRTQEYFVDVHSELSDELVTITMVIQKHHWATLVFRNQENWDPGVYFKSVLPHTQIYRDVEWQSAKSRRLYVTPVDNTIQMKFTLDRVSQRSRNQDLGFRDNVKVVVNSIKPVSKT